ncbi:MAG: M1 family aminopeptidase [Chitinophagales bacterium]
MRRSCLFVFILLIFINLHAEKPKKKGYKRNPKELEEVIIRPNNLITTYKPAYQKYFDLLNTQLTIKPVFAEKTMVGKAVLTLRPHFYDQKSLILDAKYMKINSVELVNPDGNKKLPFTYDTLKLKIDLLKYYTLNDQITVAIDYIAMPYAQDREQVERGRGLYFIDSEDKNPFKPMHLWTQGEEESSSCWFPTLDAMNQKSTEEIFVTIDKKLTSLSNGLLLDTKDNNDGTKTDHWKQDKPQSPYLFFLCVGDFYKWRTNWRDKEVSAYIFPKYKETAGDLFKNMPDMMEYFSQLLGVDFVWDKMANVIVYDYTAGAMENSSAIVYFDKMLLQKQELRDFDFDYIIAHELYHQWFGDLVTAESWANLTLNESMADYSEYLWYAHKYGKDNADAYHDKSMQGYLHTSKYKNEPILNYYYDDPHEIFDAIRYEKGGCVLHMLRDHVGDAAFFQSLNKYLTNHKFKNAELSDLRKAFEEVTGEDLQWFFNQWWLSKGHPVLDIKHSYDAKNKTIELSVRQTQVEAEGPVFRILTKVDIYNNGKKETKVIDIVDREMKFYFPAESAPQLVDFDANKVLLCEKTEDLSVAENIFKFYNAPAYKAKQEALDALSYNIKDNSAVQEIFFKALQDKNWYIRQDALEYLDPLKFDNKAKLSLTLQKMVNTDSCSQVREKALNTLVAFEKDKVTDILENTLNKDSSLMVKAAALNQLKAYDQAKAYQYAMQYIETENNSLMSAICNVFKDTTADNLEFFKKAIWMNSFKSYYRNFKYFGDYLKNVHPIILDRAVSFLKDINQYEESDYNKEGAKKVVQNLKVYFEDKAKKDQQADLKLQIVKKAGKELL